MSGRSEAPSSSKYSLMSAPTDGKYRSRNDSTTTFALPAPARKRAAPAHASASRTSLELKTIQSTCARGLVRLMVDLPHLPRPVARLGHLLERLLVLQRVHRCPEAVVLVRDQLPFRGKALERLDHELLARADVVEELLLEDEVASVDPE